MKIKVDINLCSLTKGTETEKKNRNTLLCFLFSNSYFLSFFFACRLTPLHAFLVPFYRVKEVRRQVVLGWASCFEGPAGSVQYFGIGSRQPKARRGACQWASLDVSSEVGRGLQTGRKRHHSKRTGWKGRADLEVTGRLLEVTGPKPRWARRRVARGMQSSCCWKTLG